MVVSPLDAAPRATTWDGLAAVARGCVACPELVAARTSVVPGTMPDLPPGGRAEVLFIGEAPGAQEDTSGLPFVGRSGELLELLLREVGLDRRAVAVSNVVKCRPPRNRTPRRAEVARCRPWLERQVQLADPRVVVTLGGTAAAWFFGTSARIAALREQPQTHDGRPVVVTYHPSAALRFGPAGAPRAALAADLARVAQLVHGPRAAS